MVFKAEPGESEIMKKVLMIAIVLLMIAVNGFGQVLRSR